MNKQDFVDAFYTGIAWLAEQFHRLLSSTQTGTCTLVRGGGGGRRGDYSVDHGVLMILVWLIIIPASAACLAWLADRWSALLARWVALLATLAQFSSHCLLWIRWWPALKVGGSAAVPAGYTPWLLDFSVPWIPQIGSSFHLALDGLSLLLVVLTGCPRRSLRRRLLARHSTARRAVSLSSCCWTLASITGVFLAMDLFLFYLFWELMLVPLYFLIDIWGHENRHYAAVKFFIFTQAGGLFLLLGILGFYFVHGAVFGGYTFDYFLLLGTPVPPASGRVC